MSELLSHHPHRRRNLLTGEWVLVSPRRGQRPWEGAVRHESQDPLPQHDPDCYLCPGNNRASGEVNAQYRETFVFTNDFPALSPDQTTPDPAQVAVPQAQVPDHLLQADMVQGTSRVLCFSPRHDLTLAEMDHAQLRLVVDLWCSQLTELGQSWPWVQVFENKGEIMGCSNPHPHGQIWAMDHIPGEPHKEDQQQRLYLAEHERPVLLDYLDLELASETRVVAANDDWVAVVPFWAVWPFETMLLPTRHVTRLNELDEGQANSLTDVMSSLLARYDNLFTTSFPYSMGWHGAPFDGEDNSHWQLHAHFYPPLLRSASVRKYMVGYEMLAEAQRDITPESAATRLRTLSGRHFNSK